ncbi:hypothetical protein LS684_04540 [Cytobacillus spongiae]|jgi:hypothetical protein|uniref:hypothetical protein n=1 Tax=Cytobacillus spongiae TaxID=2901381 RepID=UPI001F448B87|nr:hypothetical protein [Cytobacillus spongiae]UII56739.1 hypothetical protein LS684_04540 [Cytobacillus spongiae]
MNITTIIELENQEVEQMANAKFIFSQEQIHESIIETCVSGFESVENGEIIESDDAMQKVFDVLREKGLIPSTVEDFSFEMPSCERFKKATQTEEDMPQKVILSFSY